jgi:uncharacterized protein
VTKYREETLQQTLQGLTKMAPDIHAAILVNVDGLVIASYPTRPDDMLDPQSDQSVAATTALIMNLAQKTLERLAQGDLERVMLEGTQGTIGVYPCTHDSVLAVLIRKQAKLGLALTAAARAANDIKSILTE